MTLQEFEHINLGDTVVYRESNFKINLTRFNQYLVYGLNTAYRLFYIKTDDGIHLYFSYENFITLNEYKYIQRLQKIKKIIK